MTISLTNATRMALWLAQAHPQAFRQIAWTLRTAPARRQAGGLGRFGYTQRQLYRNYGRARSGHYAPYGAFGDDTIVADSADLVVDPNSLSLPEVTVTADASPDTLAPLSDPTLADLSVSDVTSTVTDANFDPATIAGAGDSSGFWSSLGNAFSSAGGVIASVARNLTNPATLAAAGTVASNIIKANAQTQTVNAQQQAVLATQLARVQGNLTPAAIRYATHPNGQPVPLYYNASTGQYVPAASSASTLASLLPTSAPSWLPWVLGGGIVLSLLLSRSSASE